MNIFERLFGMAARWPVAKARTNSTAAEQPAAQHTQSNTDDDPGADDPSADDAAAKAKRANRLGALALLTGFALIGVSAGVEWLLIICALLFMVFMHELGHYLTARWTGMKVTEFFIGFGPRIWSFHYGETEYGVKALWLGAYVRVIGMNNLERVSPEDESRSFRSQSYPKKLLVLTAGSAMHFLMALALLFAGLRIDETIIRDHSPIAQRDDWTLATVSRHSAASAAGLQPGDELISLNGSLTGTFEEFAERVSKELQNTEVTVVYRRDGYEHTSTTTVGERLTAAGADSVQGLIAGDRILAVKGLHTDGPPTYTEVAAHAEQRLGQPLDITILDAMTGESAVIEGATFTEIADPEVATAGFFGVAPFYSRRGLAPVAAAGESVSIIAQLTKDVVFAIPAIFYEGIADTVGSLFKAERTQHDTENASNALETHRIGSTQPDANRVISIYGVARLGVDAIAEGGLVSLLVLMLFVNIFIGVFNLLPLLPLDGGHVVVATYERVRSLRGGRYHIDATRLLPFTYAVLAFLLLIGCVALVRDIIDPVSFS